MTQQLPLILKIAKDLNYENIGKRSTRNVSSYGSSMNAVNSHFGNTSGNIPLHAYQIAT